MQARPQPLRTGTPTALAMSSGGTQHTSPADPPLQHEGILRLGVATYVVALLVIAAFSVGFHFITDSIVHRQDATAQVVNVSGRQRMLSQRIARLALERAAHTTFRAEAETDAELINAIRLMAASHEDLSRAAMPLAVAQVYTAAPYQLNSQMASFLQHARGIAAHPSATLTVADPDLLAVESAAQAPLLQALNAAVAAKQQSSEAAVQHLRVVLGRLTLLMLAILVAEALFLYRPLFNRLRLAHQELLDLGRTDPLTGCLNRRAFTQEAHALVEQCKQVGGDLSVLVIDIDRFKSINDRFGHAAGDGVIHQMVTRMIGTMKSGGRLCRMGGEEFAILLRDTDLDTAMVLAQQFRALIADKPFTIAAHDTTLDLDVTVSIGIADLAGADSSIFTVLGRADKALYRAKHNGRNRAEVEFYHPPAPVVVMGASA